MYWWNMHWWHFIYLCKILSGFIMQVTFTHRYFFFSSFSSLAILYQCNLLFFHRFEVTIAIFEWRIPIPITLLDMWQHVVSLSKTIQGICKYFCYRLQFFIKTHYRVVLDAIGFFSAPLLFYWQKVILRKEIYIHANVMFNTLQSRLRHAMGR